VAAFRAVEHHGGNDAQRGAAAFAEARAALDGGPAERGAPGDKRARDESRSSPSSLLELEVQRLAGGVHRLAVEAHELAAEPMLASIVLLDPAAASHLDHDTRTAGEPRPDDGDIAAAAAGQQRNSRPHAHDAHERASTARAQKDRLCQQRR